MDQIVKTGVFRRLLSGGIALGLACSASFSLAAAKQVKIYYDDVPGPYNSGKLYVNQLRNTLGHFHADVSWDSIDDYVSGDVAAHDMTFYIGSYYDHALPSTFLADVAAPDAKVVWFNYNIWQLFFSTNDVSHLGFTYDGIATPYDRVLYKGVPLHKGTYDHEIIRITTSAVDRVYATAYSSTNPATPVLPYALQSSNFWYFADNCLGDDQDVGRSLVLADLLHDILDTGIGTNHRAIVRIEDLNPGTTGLDQARAISDMLATRGIRGSFAVISRFLDPAGVASGISGPDVPMSEDREFLYLLQDIVQDDHILLTHGYTHNNTEEDDASGVGYEFWNYSGNHQLATDSWDYAVQRVTSAEDEFAKSGLRSHIWETPHYEASLVDYHAFADLRINWYERLRTFNAFSEGLSRAELETLASSGIDFQTQYVPYCSYEGVHGTRVLPENLNFFSDGFSDAYGNVMNSSNKLATAIRLKVVRDAVASFYFHTYLDLSILEDFLTQLEAEGYTFTDVETLLAEKPAGSGLPPAMDSGASRVVDGTTTNEHYEYFVGERGGDNSMTVINGGRVVSRGGTVGKSVAASSNRVSLVGAGSSWTNTGPFVIGERGSHNSLSLTNGATATGTYGMVGVSAMAVSNRVAVSGAGSTWQNSAVLTIGVDGPGNNLLIDAGAAVTSRRGVVGDYESAEHNRVLVTGTGSEWQIVEDLVVGYEGAGNTVAVNDGAMLHASALTLGSSASATGCLVTVDGGTINITNAGGMGVAQLLRGDLELVAATLQADNVFIGPEAVLNVDENSLILGEGSLTNRGTLLLPEAVAFHHDTVLDEPGTLSAPDDAVIFFVRDFACTSTNPSLDLSEVALDFIGGQPQQFTMNSEDRGPSTSGYDNNRALGRLNVASALTVYGIVYTDELEGHADLTVADGARVYYRDNADFSGGITRLGDAQVLLARPLPVITTQPAHAAVVEPSGATFSVVATGTPPLLYQWHRDGSPIVNATNSSYALTSCLESDSGSTFRVVIANTGGSVTSQVATLTVAPEPHKWRRPTLTWDVVPGATWYKLYISREGKSYHTVWLPQTHGSWTATFDFRGGNYKYWVQAWGPAIKSSWSPAHSMSLPVLKPGKVTLLAPFGTVSSGTPQFTWGADTNAFWYRIYVTHNGAKYASTWVPWAFESHVYPGELPMGNYKWWVQTWSPDGSGDWSDGLSFTYGQATPLAPTGMVETTRRPDFAWSETPGAAWYRLYVTRNGVKQLDKWVASPATNWTPTADQPSGAYAWWVQTWNPGGSGPWSARADFTIPLQVPGTLVPEAPTGVVAGETLDYRWQEDAKATWYKLTIERDGIPFLVHWSAASAPTGTASATVSGHVPGTYTWWVQGWGPDGLGPLNAGTTFTVTP